MPRVDDEPTSKVLVTHADGSQTVEALDDDIDTADERYVLRRLRNLGIHAVAVSKCSPHHRLRNPLKKEPSKTFTSTFVIE